MFVCVGIQSQTYINAYEHILYYLKIKGDDYTMTKTNLNISIDEELKIKLKIMAIQEKKTVSEIITELVMEYLKNRNKL